MVAAVSTMPNPKGPPRLPSESGNGVVVPRRPKSREVTSRYLSSPSSSSTTTSTSVTSSSYSSSSNSTPSRRHPSPLVSRTAPLTPLPVSSMEVKRSPLAERRRPSTPGNVGEMSATAKLLVTSRRSLSVSFQGESFSLPISRTKPAPTPAPNHLSSARKGTPERRRVAENSKLIDQRRWPGRLREVNSLTRSLDFTAEKEKLGGSGSLVSALQQSMIEDSNKASSNCRLKAYPVNDANSTARATAASDPAASDTKSVSSGNSGRVQECGSVAQEGGIAAPVRFWQENTISKDNNLNTVAPSKLNVRNKSFIENSISSPRGVSSSRGLSSPVRGAFRSSSPSKLVTSSDFSPSRGMSSPSRVRNGVASMLNNYSSNTPSILSFAAEVRRRGKVGENQIVDAHNLRLLYNRYLQWRFINSRADAAMLVQKITGEKSLYIAWVTTSKLRRSIKSKGVELQLLRQSLRLYTILKGQMLYLNNWELIDEDNSGSLSEAIEALESNTLQLPIVGGARADIQNVKDAICSAVDVMQAMASSICSLLTKVDEVNSLVSELANVTSKERALLDQCKDLLSTLTAMQVKDCSMRTQILQLSRKP